MSIDNDALDAISTARLSLILGSPFFGSLAMRLKLVEDDSINSMATDGTRLFYNPKFVATLTKPELLFVVAHETLHCSNGHPWRKGHRHHVLFNIAADFAINWILKECGFTAPKDCLLDEKYAGMSAEEIYARLPEEMQMLGCGAGEVLDPSSGQLVDGDVYSEADWREATVQAANVAKAHGKLPGSLEKLVDGMTNPRVDWKAALQNIVQQVLAKDDFSWRYPSSRYAPAGLYLPSLRSERVPPIAIGIDTSGSIGAEDLAEFAAEVDGIISQMRPERTYIIYCDTEVHRAEEYEPGDIVALKPVGGGGTNLPRIYDWIRDNGIEPACLVILSDLYTPFADEPDYEVVWACNSGEVAPYGTTIDIRG